MRDNDDDDDLTSNLASYGDMKLLKRLEMKEIHPHPQNGSSHKATICARYRIDEKDFAARRLS